MHASILYDLYDLLFDWLRSNWIYYADTNAFDRDVTRDAIRLTN